MNVKTQHRINVTDHYASRIIEVTGSILLCLGALFFIDKITVHWGFDIRDYAVGGALILTYKIIGSICLGIIALGVACRTVLYNFVSEEEDEEPKTPATNNVSPLKDLTPEQEQQVRELLRDLPANPNKPEQINMALVARYLTVLAEMGIADLSNRAALRLWVAEVAHKEVPPVSHFNEAIPNTNRKELLKVRKELKDLISQKRSYTKYSNNGRAK